MEALKFFRIGRKLEKEGWQWETWSGSFAEGTAKGWWFKPGVDGVAGMRRGDPKPFVEATLTTHELYSAPVAR